MEITTMYQKERKEFGRPVNTFAPSDVFIIDEFVPEPELRAAHVERNPTILDVQAMAILSENYVNTDTILHKSQVSAHSQRAMIVLHPNHQHRSRAKCMRRPRRGWHARVGRLPARGLVKCVELTPRGTCRPLAAATPHLHATIRRPPACL